MTIGNIIRAALGTATIQFLNENLVGATAIKAKKARWVKTRHGRVWTEAVPEQTRVSFVTTDMKVSDLAWMCRLPNQPEPENVGIIVWIKKADYDRLCTLDDPPS